MAYVAPSELLRHVNEIAQFICRSVALIAMFVKKAALGGL